MAAVAAAEPEPRRLHYEFRDLEKGDVGVCGGEVDVFIEPVLPQPTVVVVGGGHVGQAVAPLASWLGFRVVVSDDRPEYATPEVAARAMIELYRMIHEVKK